MPLTEDQKRIYNHHLSTYKRYQQKPYTLRQKFDEFQEENPEHYNALVKLESFFKNHQQVNRKLFFDAPYEIYEDCDYFDLAYYTTQKAIKCYTVYLKQLNTQSVDTPSQLQFIKDTLSLIKEYCIEHKITLVQYMSFKDGLTFAWASHIASNQTSFYVILGFNYFNFNVFDHMFEMPDDERTMLLGNIVENYLIYKTKLDDSKSAKRLVIEGLKTIEKSINKHLQLV